MTKSFSLKCAQRFTMKKGMSCYFNKCFLCTTNLQHRVFLAKFSSNILDNFAKSLICFLFVIPAPYQVRDKLKQESSNFRLLWTPAPRLGRGQVSRE